MGRPSTVPYTTQPKFKTRGTAQRLLADLRQDGFASADPTATSVRCLQKPREALHFTRIYIGHCRETDAVGCPGRDVEATQVVER